MSIIFRYFVLLLLTLSVFPLQASSIISITSTVPPDTVDLNTGLFSTEQFTPVGGNNATTLGQARINAAQYAANKLSIMLNSRVKIKVLLSFQAQEGDSKSATLASTTVTGYQRDFSGAPIANTLYPIVLAEKLSGIDFNAGSDDQLAYEMTIIANSDIDGPVALGNNKWYYGFDEKAGTDYDFVTVLMHEMIHGLGFGTPSHTVRGIRKDARNDIYLYYLEHHGAVPANYSEMTLDSQRVAGNKAAIYGMPRFPDKITGTNLHWVGPALIRASNGNDNFGFQTTSGHAGMYSPRDIQLSSSISHFTQLFEPGEMMEPVYKVASHDIGFAAQILEDIGWGKLNTNSNPTDVTVDVSNFNDVPLLGSNEMYTVTVSNNGGQTATGIIVSNFLPAGSDFISFSSEPGMTCETDNVTVNHIITCSVDSLAASTNTVFYFLVKINKLTNNVFTAAADLLNPDFFKINNNATNRTVAFVTTPKAPVLFAEMDQFVRSGDIAEITITAVDPNGTPANISMIARPAGSSFTDNRDGTGTFSWQTSNADVGSVVLNFNATDGDPNSTLSDSLSLNLTVSLTAKPKPTPVPVIGGTVRKQTKSKNSAPAGGCSFIQTAKFDPMFPILLLMISILYLRKKKQLSKVRK